MFKKIISSVLIAGQLGFAASAMAAGTDTAISATPELTLFTSSLAVVGEKLSTEETQAQLSQLFLDYEKAAPQDGQADRIEQAMVAMNIYTPEQAHQFTADAQTLSASMASANAQAASDELNQLLAARPAGAQFSSCDLSIVIGASGAAAALSGGGLWVESNSINHHNSEGQNVADPHGEHVGELLVIGGLIGVADAIIITVYAHGC